MDFPFDIYDVADQLGLELKKQHPKSSDYNCPFCDGRAKLNLNVEHNVFRCNRCGEYGGMIDLFCKLTGTSDRKTAYRLLAEHNGYSVTQREVRKKTVSSIKEAEKADIKTLHKCYSAMLSILTLNPSHKRNLLERGLSEEQIRINMYRSVPRGEYDHIVYRLLEQNLNLIGVPGFYVSDEGEIKINLHQCTIGFFVPVFDECGYIQGMQIRLDSPFESKRKYIWLSSSEKNGGCSSGSPVQISGNIFDSEVIYVTEGPLKGQIAHHLCGKTFLAVAGVNQQKELDSLFLRIRNEGKCSTIVDAFDMDDDKNEHVLRGHRNLAWLAVKYGFSPKRVTWDRRYKGIDDYLLAVRTAKEEAL